MNSNRTPSSAHSTPQAKGSPVSPSKESLAKADANWEAWKRGELKVVFEEDEEPSLTPEQEAESDDLFPPGPLSPQAVEAVRSGKLPAVFAELFPEQFPPKS